MYSILLGKLRQSLAKPGKIKCLDRPRQTELAKHIHGVNSTAETMQTPQSNGSALVKTLP